MQQVHLSNARAALHTALLSIQSTQYYTQSPYHYYYSVHVWVLYLICNGPVSGQHFSTCRHFRYNCSLSARSMKTVSVEVSRTISDLVGEEIYVHLPMKHCTGTCIIFDFLHCYCNVYLNNSLRRLRSSDLTFCQWFALYDNRTFPFFFIFINPCVRDRREFLYLYIYIYVMMTYYNKGNN